LFGVRKRTDELLRGVCDREQLKAAQRSIGNSIETGGDAKALREELQNDVQSRNFAFQLSFSAY
jgi:hypothetical protein